MARYEKGQSGNPKGRPKGSRNRLSRRLQDTLDADLDQLVGVLRTKALAGDIRALKLIVERILPIPKDEPIQISEALPAVTSAKGAVAYATVILRSIGRGEVTPSEAANVMHVVEGYLRAQERGDLEQRIEVLEQSQSDIAHNLKESRHGAKGSRGSA
jgi:hypothetical protein